VRLLRLSLASALAVAVAVPARADQVHFTGRTTVDGIVIRDALQTVLRVAAASLHCNQLTAVEASVLPAGWAPADPASRVGPAQTRYERWDAALCGHSEPFLLGFWPASDGGTMFQVHFPYPPDGPPATAVPPPGS
jgi:hypothetical protein